MARSDDKSSCYRHMIKIPQKPEPQPSNNVFATIGRLAKKVKFGRRSALLLAVLTFISTIGTYMVFTRSDGVFAPDKNDIFVIIGINIILMLVLASFITHRAIKLWFQLKQGSIGSKLQTKVLTVFSLAAIIPTIIIAIFSAYFFNYGASSWFDDRVSATLDSSVLVAESYLKEHKKTIRSDAASISNILQKELHKIIINPVYFSKILDSQANIRSISEAVVLQNKRVIAHSRFSFSVIFDEISDDLLARVALGEIVILDNEDKITAIAPIDIKNSVYLVITKFIDNNVLSYANDSKGAADQYHRAKSRIEELQTTFVVIYVLITITLLMIVVWYGMIFVSKLVIPISEMVKATEHITAGDYSIRIANKASGKDEISTLINRFNRMAEQLAKQRDDLTLSNRKINERRRFTEAVIDGASAGVIATDAEQNISLYNGSALELLTITNAEELLEIIGSPLPEIIPEMKEILDKAKGSPEDLHQDNITITNKQNKTLTLHVRITAQMTASKVEGYIITFDDISPLLSAQRSAAWADVARRIAHEIKNPLTPIQLSAERIRKKYQPEDDDSEQSKEDIAAFNRYLDTIVKHSKDIGNMIEEFASFARMPNPVFKAENIADILKKAIFSAQTGFGDIKFSNNISDKNIDISCDERQIRQVITNLLKNSAESIERSQNKNNGEIEISTNTKHGNYQIKIIDNGVGLPENLLDTIMEPYVTTREKGTGLGLAIVKKTIEDHKGSIELSNIRNGDDGDILGALVVIDLPLS